METQRVCVCVCFIPGILCSPSHTELLWSLFNSHILSGSRVDLRTHSHTHTQKNRCTSCWISPDSALDSVISVFLCLYCIRVSLLCHLLALCLYCWERQPQRSNHKCQQTVFIFIDTERWCLLMWNCTPVTALKWPKSHHLLSPQKL